jgi:hypothetical protein
MENLKTENVQILQKLENLKTPNVENGKDLQKNGKP